MNEINLQNPEFLERISALRWNNKGLHVFIQIKSKMTGFTARLYSKNKPLDDAQYWSNEDGKNIETLAELDQEINLCKQESNELDIILGEYSQNNTGYE